MLSARLPIIHSSQDRWEDGQPEPQPRQRPGSSSEPAITCFVPVHDVRAGQDLWPQTPSSFVVAVLTLGGEKTA